MAAQSVERGNARPQDEDDQEGDVTGQDLPFGVDGRAGCLRNADDDAAGQRAPQAAEPADDDGLEGEYEPCRTDRGIEIGAHPKEQSRQRGDGERDAHGDGEEAAVVDAHELGDVGIVGHGAEGAADRCTVEELVQPDDDGDGGCERQHRQHAHGDAAAQRHGGRLPSAGRQAARIGGEGLQQAVLDDDRQAEGHQQRREDIAADGAVQHERLQQIADDEHQRQRDEGRDRQRQPQHRRHRENDEGCQHDKVAMGQVDEAHDAEDQRQAGGEQGVEPAQEHALHDDVDDGAQGPRPSPRAAGDRASVAEIGIVDRLPRQFLWSTGERHAALAEAVDPVGDLERLDDVLLDDDDAGALTLDGRQRGIDVADDHWREAQRYLVA
jgi:hypothetical protein